MSTGRSHRYCRVQPARAILVLALFAAVTAAPSVMALTGRVVGPDGSPLVNGHVSIAGRNSTVTTSARGEFVIEPDPKIPFTLVVVDAQGRVYPPVEIAQLPDALEIRLSPYVSESLTVTSGIASEILAPPAAATTFVGREDLEQRVPDRLVDAVTRVAGVEQRGEGPPAVAVIRGLSGGRTAIIVDGMRVTTERRAGPSATFLEPFTLASIEIARGPGSVAYGSDAFGGVIHARTRDPEPGKFGFAYELSAGFAASDSKSAGVTLSSPLGLGGASLQFHGRDSKGSESSGGDPIDNSQFDARGAAVRVVHPLRNGIARAALSIDRVRDAGAPGADSNVTRTFYPREEMRRLSLTFDNRVKAAEIEVQLSASSYETVTNRERLPAGSVRRQIASSEVAADDTAIRVTAAMPAGRAFLHTGAELTSRFSLRATGTTTLFDASGAVASRREEVAIADASRHDLGLFLLADIPLTSRLTFGAGVRGDALRVRSDGGYFGTRSRSDSALSGHAAVTWTRRAFSTTFQFGSGFREPSLSDRYFRGVSGRGFVTGNPDLEPERSYQADYTARWQRGGRSIAFFAYDYRIRDLVERYAAGTDFAFRNRGEAVIRGVEIEFATPLRHHLSAHGNLSAARGESEGRDLDDITPLKSHLEIRWALRRRSLFASATWFAADGRPGPVETARPARLVVDAGAGWKLRESADLRLSLRNVLDERYAGSADANAALAPGRAITLSIHGRV